MSHLKILLLAVLSIFFTSCREDILENEVTLDELGELTDWTEETHSKNVDPDYSIVFNQDEVLRFDISISSENWALMQSDLATNLSSTGGGPGNGGGPGGGGPGNTVEADFDPIWVPCSFYFEDKEWYKVGVRFKGNSSLKSAYQSGNNKLSFKLDFDEFEDDYPQIKNQRFYGFKQLNLNNNYDDASLMREKVVADLFRDFGLISSQTTFCAVYVNHGEGPQYFGVYALVEEMDDTAIETQVGDDSGNLYKPDGTAASFAQGSYNESEMEKKSNEDEADYSDVKALYEVINSSNRTNDVALWKSDLSAVLDVDGFLKWLAANTVIQNWDTYGLMTHNYYLYNMPETGLLTWIPWDNNEALQEGKQGGALSLDLNSVGSSWPLISYLIADDDYEQIYQAYVRQFVDEVFIPAKLTDRYQSHYNLIKNYAYAEESGYTFLQSNASFDYAVEGLKTHAQSRLDAVNNYLEE